MSGTPPPTCALPTGDVSMLPSCDLGDCGVYVRLFPHDGLQCPDKAARREFRRTR
jgi:hypothetical protein